ncbi:DUF3043 domain-containing protein [uncultured Nocardioides sp.]|uniref:DUF3043 domain-containing protein n=1 Tax=uncultured Nocardioides sp. TaxID=198441 RepID=UPI002631A3D0|nr:DUF3043 domain-containing protein [uncultured Nocardioides sp.]
MFRRSKSESAPETISEAADGSTTPGKGTPGKGRPTPSRKEAEAAARARAKVPRTRKEQAAAARAQRAENSAKVRAAMKSGDERFLLPRDKGPVRRFIRDFVDSRFSFIDVIVPVLIVTMVLSYSGNQTLAGIGSTVLMLTVLLVVVDMIQLRFRVRRQLAQRFPGESTKGTTWYAISRAMQMKFMRMPKAQVKIGQQLPEHYR